MIIVVACQGFFGVFAGGWKKMVHGLMTAYKFGTFVPKEDFSKGTTLFVIFVLIVGFALATSAMIVKTFEK